MADAGIGHPNLGARCTNAFGEFGNSLIKEVFFPEEYHPGPQVGMP